MEIKNTSQLIIKDLDKNQSYLRKIGLKALEKAIFAVKPKNLISKSIKKKNHTLIIKNDEYDLRKFKKIYIIGGGKATAEMAFTLEKLLSSLDGIDYKGIINIPQEIEKLEEFKQSKISINIASHPIPDESGLNGTRSMMQIIENSHERDLIFCLISGGGSALLPLPKQGITLKDLQDVNSLLLASGASIHEINAIRKHLSDFKGGNLVRKLYYSSRAKLISLIISDVVGDNLDSIASGPTVPDSTTFEDAINILKKYVLLERIPSSVKNHLERGLSNKELETPKPNDSCFKNVHNYLIGSVKSAVLEITSFLSEKDFKVDYFSNEIAGEAKEFGESLYSIISKKIEENFKKEEKYNLALIGTGELTVTIQGKGVGGRNQEMSLSFLNYIKGIEFDYDFLIIGANLDGMEGNSKAMGALVDNFVLNQILDKRLDLRKFLDENDSNNFFKILQSEIITGQTGCNVNDLILILISKKRIQ